MTVFVVIAVVMAAAAAVWVLPPLLRRHSGDDGVARSASNLEVYRDQLAELDADLNSGTLSAAQYEQAKLEIERRVLDEVGGEGVPGPRVSRSARRTAAVLATVIPLAAASLYWLLGNPDALSPQRAGVAGGASGLTMHEVEAMVAKLAARLEQNPDDANGWAILARSYAAMQRFPEAIAAYAKAAALTRDDADLLADYADALAASAGRNLEGKPLELVKQALKIDPNQWKALAMAGTAAFDRKDYQEALVYWEQLLAKLPSESQFRQTLTASIDEARQLGGIKPGALPAPLPAAGDGVRGTVSLSPALAGSVKPTDTVFIFTRAAEGPRQPIAAVRRQAIELPAQFTLDDSQSMSAGMKLSSFREVVVGARISKSGSATPQSGDLQGISQKVKVGATDVAVVIDSVVP
ncbi:MAG: c-type cytochrome biogenesis protein CcmI [Betaproteobacteria bacterium]|nr:c-type cytochrome biogenesis protein CcmI [Betaproteobacteria bacterium]